jgi:multisubunit Na+/H+ antiporter MnhB subunit
MPSQTLSPRAAAWLGALFGVVGLVILLLALRIIPAAESKFQAPHWVVGAAGLAFFLVGILLLTTPPDQTSEAAARTTWRTFLLGGGVVGAMAAIFNWVAFGPGPRHFGGSISIPFVTISGPQSEWSGRAAFGLVAVMMDLFLGWVIVRGLRDLLGRAR